MKICTEIVFFMLLMVTLLAVNTAYADTEINSSEYTINKSGKYYLAENIICNSSNNCISITCNDVVVDGRGFTLDGNNSGINGIYMIGMSTQLRNITLKNLRIINFTNNGIYQYNAISGLIKNNTICHNGMNGITVYNTYIYEILNNNISSNKVHGFTAYYSNSNNIINNTLDQNNQYGIYLYYSINNILENNTLSKNKWHELYIESSDRTKIKNTTISSNDSLGIAILDSEYNVLNNNSLNSGGISITGRFLENWNTHTFENNTVDRKPIYYYKDVNNSIVPEDAGQVILANCNDFLIENITVSNLFTGLQMAYSSNNTLNNVEISNSENGMLLFMSNNSSLLNNKIYLNENYGIYLQFSNNNTIYNCNISNNKDGFKFFLANNNTLSSNLLKNNEIGIYLSNLNDNAIYNNIFNNTENIKTGRVVGLNYWNTTKENGGGNYWFTPNGTGFSETNADTNNDGFCDEPYSIIINNIDYLPKYLKKEEPTPTKDNNNNRRRTIDASDSIESKSLRRTVSDSTVVYGSNFDKQLANSLKENTYSDDTEIDGDTIILGGPVSNRIANQYNDRFSIPVTNDNPGTNRGIIQVISIPSGSSSIVQSYKLIYIAGSDRLGTEAALKYFETLTELPDEPITVEWVDGKSVLV
ncbi:parallel beta-helix repeat protein [Methanococcus voltae]|uniref:Parallel beta-helix repeat protein n=1 Tax=Methanococcus voltae TaxID=2188 RepID=A0A8J7S4H0_METVO|nr:NosD domain-containing protein [Methanococcus voltae]MBP2201228.1 parallel beta-helix repeat protein [Methanococcus voltae]